MGKMKTFMFYQFQSSKEKNPTNQQKTKTRQKNPMSECIVQVQL